MSSKYKMTTKGEHDETPAKKGGACSRVCQSPWCLPVIFLGIAAGIAVAAVVVALSPSVRQLFAPDMRWWQKTILYQVYPRSFQDSDDDGLGDLKGISSRLNYFNYLHVDAVWLSPFYPSPMRDFGYDVTNHTDVDRLFGNITDFDDLLKEAHNKNLKVIIDFIPGHTSSDHRWFELSSNRTEDYEDFYIWANGTTLKNGTVVPPNNWVSAFGYSAWNWSDARQQFYYHAFLPEQPTLNYRNPQVVKEMQNVVRFWMDRGVDGIRVDAVGKIMVSEDLTQNQARSFASGAEPWEEAYFINNLTTNQPEIADIIRGWRHVLDSYTEDYRFMVVELYEPPEIRKKYVGYGADMAFNFDLLTALDNHYQLHHNVCDAICIRDVIKKEYDNLPEGGWANFVLSNHDNHRAASRMGPRYVDALHVLLLTLRGTPTTYYGEEIGMMDIPVSFNDTKDPAGKNYGPNRYNETSRDPERSPMQWDANNTQAGFSGSSNPWLPVSTDYHNVNVEAERNSKNVTTIQVYRALAKLRQNPSLTYGLLTFGTVTSKVISYLRAAYDFPSFFVAINFGNETVQHDFSGSPVSQTHGQVKVVTSQAANEGRFAKGARISLTQVQLHPGDGLVFELDG